MGQCTSGELPLQSSPAHTVNSHIGKNGASSQCPPPLSTTVTATTSPPTTTITISPTTANTIGFTRRRSKSSRHRQATATAASWVNRISRRQKNKDLSATFNLLDYDTKTNYLDINVAAEEELMTLRGVTRGVARSIVEYRTAIGGFRRVEDLALVSGVGAARLQQFRSDVVVGGRRRSSSRSSSRTQSVDSLPSCESGRSQRSQPINSSSRPSPPPRTLNVNSATIFELMTVRGMTQEMAANIVEYRERKGPFRTMGELVKVRGVSNRVLSLLKVYLSLGSPGPSSFTSTTSPPPHHPASDVISVVSYGRTQHRAFQSRMLGHRRTYSAPLNNENSSQSAFDPKDGVSPRVSVDFNADIFELLSLRSERPIVGSMFSGRHQGRPAFRVATWNLQRLTRDKVSNLGVLEVVCRTILENGFSLVALQEVASRDVLERICSELNQGSLRRVREWNGPRGEWRWQVSEEPAGRMGQSAEYAAFIYNVDHGLQLVSASLLTVHNNNHRHHPARKPYLGYFKFYEYDFVVVSLHIDVPELIKKKRRTSRHKEEQVDDDGNGTREPKSSQLTPLVSALKEKLNNEKSIVLLGDFNMSPENTVFDVLRDASYSSIVPCEVKGDTGESETVERDTVQSDDTIDGSKENGDDTSLRCFDNIWLNSNTRTTHTGQWGVIREGLCHMAIPCGWGWGGAASEHPPVYCDLCPGLLAPSPTHNAV